MYPKVKQIGVLGLSVLTILAIAGCGKEEALKPIQIEKQVHVTDASKSEVKIYKESELKTSSANDLYRMISETQGGSGTLFDELSNSYSKADKNEKLRDNKAWQKEQVARIADVRAHLKNAQILLNYTSQHDSFGADTDKVVDSQKLISNFFHIKLESLEIEYEQLIRHDRSYMKDELEKKKVKMKKIQKDTAEQAKNDINQ